MSGFSSLRDYNFICLVGNVLQTSAWGQRSCQNYLTFDDFHEYNYYASIINVINWNPYNTI